MKYMVQFEISAEVGSEVEAHPDKLQEWVGKWRKSHEA